MPLSQSQYKEILKKYDSLRTKNSDVQRSRQEEISNKIPAMKNINQEIINVGLETAKAIVSDPENKSNYLSKLEKSLASLKSKRVALLAKNGYPSDYLEPIYNCPLCKDTGYIGDKKCTCLKQELITIAYEQSNIEALLQKENFSTFSLDLYSDEKLEKLGFSPRENARGAYNRCLRFVESFDSEFSNLILFGQTGLGKTFLCNCIAKALLDSSHSVIYLSAFNFFKLLENYRFKNDSAEIIYEDIDDLYTCDLLIIDDLGSEIINSFTSSELFSCLNTRILARKSTVISTNLQPSGLSKYYSERIVSRILGDFVPIQLIGEDIRLQKYK